MDPLAGWTVKSNEYIQFALISQTAFLHIINFHGKILLLLQKLLQKGQCKGQKKVRKNIQTPLGFATMGLAAALGFATATPLTDLRQCINCDLGFSDLERKSTQLPF